MTRSETIMLNRAIRARYPREHIRTIRHYRGAHSDETHATVDRMPGINQPGRIYIGDTDRLLRQVETWGKITD